MLRSFLVHDNQIIINVEENTFPPILNTRMACRNLTPNQIQVTEIQRIRSKARCCFISFEMIFLVSQETMPTDFVT